MSDSDNPQTVSFTQERFPRTWKVIEQGLEQKIAPGFVVGVWSKKKPNQFIQGAWGKQSELGNFKPLSIGTVFDLASLTKIIATGPLAAVLVDRGWLSWDTPVGEILRDCKVPGLEIRHLLSHTGGFVAWKPFWEILRAQFVPRRLDSISGFDRQKVMKDLILAEVPDEKPGTRMLYSDVSFILLGYILEEITCLPLDEAVREWVWRPLGLKKLHYRPRVGIEDIAPTENCPWRGRILQGEVHDDNCWAMGGVGGHAGVFGPVEELLRLIRGLVTTHFLSRQKLQEMWTRVADPKECSRTLGWDTPLELGSSIGQFFSRRSVGHLGFTGTSLWYDLDAELAVVLLSNRVHPSRENIGIREFRPIFHDALWCDLFSKERFENESKTVPSGI